MATPFRYIGDKNEYVDIAVRMGNEYLGINLSYKVAYASGGDGKGEGVILARFVAHGDHMGKFDRFDLRDGAKFKPLNADGTTGEKFGGVRLNKFFIRIFDVPVAPDLLGSIGDKLNLWALLAGWIREQFKADGFTVAVDDLPGLVRSLLAAPIIDTNTVHLALAFPDLAAYKAHKTKAVEKAKFYADDDDDGDDDGDNDDDDEVVN